ncbi:Hypothetical predicted protein [Lecanosticta acicola]|uniref:LsmAD domain-containing protein n=1 Tax=Lecanosticta acicola TaxID=111012 RepID=A0AAI9EBE8_9PEZI|nr:Hypothetical predicted protein [Lecanosticta acicola]
MSAPSLNGGDAAKSTSTSATSKPQLRSSASGKALDGARKQAASPVDGQSKKQQPKAWQGPNPITQRASNVPNGNEKPLPKPSQQQAQKQSTNDLHSDKHAHDRSLFLLAQFIGKDVTLSLKNGEQFAGVYSGCSLELSKTQHIIKMARRTRPPTQQQANGNTGLSSEYIGQGEDYVMSFDVQDTVDLFVEDVSTAATATQQNGSVGSSFLTDTQISGRDPYHQRERELQRWDAGPDTSLDLSLGDPKDASWDQFAANEQMYGVQSTYDEDIYTTSIDRSNPDFKRRQAEAERIAREIEGSAAATSHVAEERRKDVYGDDGGDEEDKYSGVRRETVLPQRGKGSYVPPNQRPQAFDPAIISVSKPTPSPAQAPSVAAASTVAPALVTEKPAAKEAVPSPSVAAPKKKENTTEDRVRDTADAFKQFANNEKLRLRNVQEAKRASARQEKNVKLNDLKKFAANFKLKSRVPDDLVPILAKDPGKQLEIQTRAEEAAKLEEVRSKDKSDKGSTVASPAPSAATAQAGPSAAADQRMTFNQQQVRNGRALQQPRGGPLSPSHQGPARQPYNHIQRGQFTGRPGIPPQPLPADLRIPTAAPVTSTADMPMSPTSATRLNVNAKSFEFRPGASAFTPTGTTPSPQRSTGSGIVASPIEATASFFDKVASKETKSAASVFDPLKRMAETDYNENEKKKYTSNGGLPQAYNTPPTWNYPKANDNVSHLSMFPKPQAPSQGPSPLHTPNPNGQMPHAHQLPPHMQGQPMPNPAQRPGHYFPQQPHGPPFDPRFQQQFAPNGSVQNSPRPPHGMPAFNAQMAPFPQQGMPGQPMPAGYGASPSMGIRQPNMPPQSMMMPGQQNHMMQMAPNFTPGPHFRPQPMGGHMMVQQQSGSYPSGPVPQGYSPMPPHPQPHMPHMQQNGPAGYSGSPRPPMMQHQGSHQGYQQQMQPHFMPSPGQPHPYHMQQRAMSGGFPQMTPRQQHSIPNHPSPGMVPAQGDEGKSAAIPDLDTSKPNTPRLGTPVSAKRYLGARNARLSLMDLGIVPAQNRTRAASAFKAYGSRVRDAARCAQEATRRPPGNSMPNLGTDFVRGDES